MESDGNQSKDERNGVRSKFEKIRDQNWPIHNSREINCFGNVIIKKKRWWR